MVCIRFWMVVIRDQLNKFAGLLLIRSGKSCIIYAKTRTVCCTKIQWELSTMVLFSRNSRNKQLLRNIHETHHLKKKTLVCLWICLFIEHFISEQWGEDCNVFDCFKIYSFCVHFDWLCTYLNLIPINGYIVKLKISIFQFS